jgi:hypothetical protein
MPTTRVFTSRDYQILWYAWHCRFLTLLQYHRLFWNKSTVAAARPRLRALVQRGLLGSIPRPPNKAGTLYVSTRPGIQVLIESGILSPSLKKDYPRRPEEVGPGLDHDLMVNDIRIAFEETGSIPITWVSDHQLRQQRHRNSFVNSRVADGLFEWESHGIRHKGVLEFERWPYGRRRLQNIVSRLRTTHPTRTVFFVVLTRHRTLTVSKIVRFSRAYVDRPQDFYISDFPSVATSGLEGDFTDLEGNSFRAPGDDDWDSLERKLET